MKFINNFLSKEKNETINFEVFNPFPRLKFTSESYTQWTVCYESDFYIISVKSVGRDSLEYFGGSWEGLNFLFSATHSRNGKGDFLWTVNLTDIYLASTKIEPITRERLDVFRHEVAPYICEALKVFGYYYGSKGLNSVDAVVKGARLQ
jgi:hypothetical protein